jgi:hypothetical protein
MLPPPPPGAVPAAPPSRPSRRWWRNLTAVGLLTFMAAISQIAGVSARDLLSRPDKYSASVNSADDACKFLRWARERLGSTVSIDISITAQSKTDNAAGLSIVDPGITKGGQALDLSMTTRDAGFVIEGSDCPDTADRQASWSMAVRFLVPPTLMGSGVTYISLASRRLSGQWRIANYERPGVGSNILTLRLEDG